MFSSRLRSGSELNRVSRALLQRRAENQPWLDLTVSNPTAAGLEYPAELLEALVNPRALEYRPDPLGLLEAREAVVAAMGSSAAVDRTVLTASTSEAYAFLFKLLCNPGDHVLVPRPSYPLFEFLAELENVGVDFYSLFYDNGWHIDMADLERQIGPGTRAVVVVNPNNPTGSFLKRSEYEELATLCARSGIALISDEVFSPFAFREDSDRVTTVLGSKEILAFSLNGLSKLCALPQMKLGWICASGPENLVTQAMSRLEIIADTFLSVNTPVQLAAAKLLSFAPSLQRQMQERTRVNLSQLTKLAADTSVRVLEVEGGWYAVLQVPRIRTEEEWVLKLLEEEDVLVQPGFFYDFPAEGFLVLSILTPPEEFAQGCMRILKS